jgi:DUF4097 and DUF4098 domain-containing protein YvlB
MAGPLVLIIIGVVFLLGTMHVVSLDRLGEVFARYWPLLIILWGVVKLIEHQQAQKEGTRAPGIGGGGIFLLIMLILLGLGATQVSRVNWGEVRDQIDLGDQDFQLFGHSYSYDDQLAQAFPAGATLHVLSDHGAVQVNASTDDQIRVVVHKRVTAERKEDADKWNAATKPQISAADRSITLNANTQAAGEHGVVTDLEITIPRKAGLVISAHRGDISVVGRDGDVDLSGQHGDTTASDINGKVSVNMTRGSARVSQTSGDVAVQGRGDEISLQEIKGNARITGEFDSVKLAKIANPVLFKSARTDLEFARLDGDLDMDSGDLRATDLAGPFRLLTRSKDVRLTGVNGDVRLQNENGSVEVHVNKVGSMDMSNRNSEIEVYLPDKAGFQVEARVRGGEIESDFKDLKIENADDNGSASGSVGGGGPRLVLNNEHGTIAIRKGSSLAGIPPAPPAPPMPKVPKVPDVPKVPEVTEN